VQREGFQIIQPSLRNVELSVMVEADEIPQLILVNDIRLTIHWVSIVRNNQATIENFGEVPK
jgi:hypothetical protein